MGLQFKDLSINTYDFFIIVAAWCNMNNGIKTISATLHMNPGLGDAKLAKTHTELKHQFASNECKNLAHRLP